METGSSREGRHRVPPLHLVTDDGVMAAPGFAAAAENVLRAGGPSLALHLRGHRTAARALFGLAERLLPAATDAGAFLLVNDRLDVALAAGGHGVQLGKAGMPVREARRLLGPTRWIGASVHSVGEAAAAVDATADFLIAGTLFSTPSHPGRAGSGTAWLTDLSRLGVPVIGIGGITPARVPEVVAAGGHGVALLRGVWAAPRPVERILEYLAALNLESDGERHH